MKAASYRFNVDGDSIRVVIAGDVIALPEEGWSYGNFGSHISEEWLLTQPRPKIPGNAHRRKVLVGCIRAAMAEHHAAACRPVAPSAVRS